MSDIKFLPEAKLREMYAEHKQCKAESGEQVFNFRLWMQMEGYKIKKSAAEIKKSAQKHCRTNMSAGVTRHSDGGISVGSNPHAYAVLLGVMSYSGNRFYHRRRC